jgi:hypothetical protein
MKRQIKANISAQPAALNQPPSDRLSPDAVNLSLQLAFNSTPPYRTENRIVGFSIGTHPATRISFISQPLESDIGSLDNCIHALEEKRTNEATDGREGAPASV